ncbi:unnamed protein product [Rhizophagus irregularis]|nr:unnamed protein product [Rhizophagus irregularis]
MPPKRLGTSAVLRLDGQGVIIYGGSSDAKPVDSSLYELNLINYELHIEQILGYNESEENDILLLDISNKDEYIWTNEYDPSSSNISAQSFNESSKVNVNIYRSYLESPDNGNIHNYELESSNNVNIHNHGREFVESSNNENIYNHRQEIVEPPSNERTFNHGREINLNERSKTETNNKVPLSMNKFGYVIIKYIKRIMRYSHLNVFVK